MHNAMRYTELCTALESALMSAGYTNSVYRGDVYDIWNNKEVQYVSACYDLIEAVYDDNLNQYNVRVYVADRLVEAETNETYALDACEAVIRHAIATLRSASGVLDIGCSSLVPFVQTFADNLAGYYADLQIQVINKIDNC